MYTKLIALSTVCLSVLSAPVVANTWAETINKAEAYKITTGNDSLAIRGAHSNDTFKRTNGKSGFMFGNVIGNDIPLPFITDITKVIRAIESGSKTVVVATDDFTLPANAMLCEIASQLKAECAEFTEMFYKYTATNDSGYYDAAKGVASLKELEASVIANLESFGIDSNVKTSSVSVETINVAIEALEVDAEANKLVIEALEAQVKTLEAAAVVDADLLASVNSELAKSIAKQADLQKFLLSSEGQLKIAKSALSIASDEIETLETKVATIKAILKSTITAHQVAIDELAAARDADVEGLQADINALVADQEAFIAVVAELDALALDRLNMVIARNDTIDTLVGKIQTLEAYKFNTTNVVANLEAQLENSAQNLANSVAAKAALTTKYDNLASDYAAQGNLLWQSNTDKVTALFDLSNETAAHNATKAELQSISNQLDQAKTSKAELDAAYAEAIANANTLGNTIVNLNNQVNALEGQVSSKAAKLLAAQDVIYAAQNTADFLAVNLGSDPVTIETFEDVKDFLDIVPMELWETISSLSVKNTILTNSLADMTSKRDLLQEQYDGLYIEWHEQGQLFGALNDTLTSTMLQLSEANSKVTHFSDLYDAKYQDWLDTLDQVEAEKVLTAEANTKIASLAATIETGAATIATLNSTITSLEATIDAFVEPVLASQDSFTIPKLAKNLSPAQLAIDTAALNAVTGAINSAGLNGEIGDMVTLDGDFDVTHPAVTAFFDGGAGSYVFTGEEWEIIGAEAGKMDLSVSNVTVDYFVEQKDDIVSNFSVTTFRRAGFESDFGDASITRQLIDHDILGEVLTYTLRVGNTTIISGVDDNHRFKGIKVLEAFEKVEEISKQLVEESFDNGYESGYEDGYNDGYKDGYAVGFSDAKAGVEFDG